MPTYFVPAIETTFVSGFENQNFEPNSTKLGKAHTIECKFLGRPRPEVSWFLDGYHLPNDG